MKRSNQMSKSMVAAMMFGVAMLLLSGIVASQCGNSKGEAVVILDTVTLKQDTVMHDAVRPRRARKKKPAEREAQPAPESRDYRDEVVN